MVKNAVKILDINNNLLGSGILLDGHVATVDHILNIETNYFIKINNNIYPAQVIYRSKDMATPVDIAMLSVNIHENYKPNVTEVSLNDSVEAKGFPQGGRYAIYPQGRHISGKVISFNYIDMTDKYPYCGNYITISSDEDITIGFSGAPVFVEDTLIGLVARKHIDDKPNNFNVVPIKYYLDANNGMFRNLFGEYNGFDKQNVLNKQIKSLINPFHFRSGSIDFVGRYDQIDQLFQFCSSSVSVQWWAITGVGGIGKSRLAYEFARSLNENVWDSIMLNTYDYESLKTKSTHIKKNTLIVLDYVQQNIRDIGKWLYTLTENETDHKVRVLLLERYGKSYRTAKWIERLNEKNCEYDVLVSMCYNPTMLLDPPFLVLPSLSKEDLVSITENYCKYNNALVESSTIQNIINQLDIIDPGYNRPLYLVFLIDAWIDNRDLLNWNKKFILESVLTREIHRIKLILRNFLNDDLLINAYLNVLIYSTIMDGLRYTDEFKVICGEELKVFQESTEYHRKDIMFFFSQMGFLTEDNDGVLIFEGLKPDLLGEYFIFNYDSNSTVVNNIIQRSLLFPERAFSFYHRLLDDYSSEIDSNFRLSLLNINTIELSIEQICLFANFLCERIVRDNYRHSVQCLKCLNLLYMQNKGVDTAIIYAAGLFNMLDQLNLKKSRKLILELENLYYDYCDSLDVAMEYVYSLLHVMERKSLYAAKKIFEKLKILCKKVPFVNNLEFNLCYAKALKVLCSKEINKYMSLEYCKELKELFLEFSENEEFACVYAHCLCSLNKDLSNINNILIELLSLCNYTLVQPIYGMYIVDNFRSGTLTKEESLKWLHNKYDFNLYIDKIEERPITHFDNMDDNLYKKDEIDCKQKNTCKPEPQESINLDIDKARKLAWLSNNLNYQQCKGVVAELKVLCERHKDTYEFIEYYLIGIVTLSKQNRQDLVETYELLENILKISNRFFNNFEEDLRISVYESISKLLEDNVFTTDLKLLLDSFINMISKDLRTEQETVKIMSLLIVARHSEIDAIVDDYFEGIIAFYMNSNLIQKQYIKYIEAKNNCDLEYILNNLPRFYSFNCKIIFKYMSNKILTFSSAYTDEKVIDFIANFLSKNKIEDLAYVYSEIILRRFLKKPELQYYNILKSLETEYYPNFKIALNYAKLLYTVGENGLLNFDELYNRIKVLENTYSDKSIALIVQKILSRKVIDTISNNSYEKYIKEQKKLFDMYGTLEFAVEYCNSLSVISGNLSERENSKNYINIKKIAKNFQNRKAFEICLKRIAYEIEKSREYLYAQETTDEEVNLCNLKSQIQHLYINGEWNDVLRVEKVVKSCREAYMEFYHVDFAILLCRVLGTLLKLVSNEVVSEIVNEVETIYNRYPDEPVIFKQYLKVISSALSSNCILDGEKINSLEKTLVQIIRKDKKCGDEIYGMLLLILHTKKSNENNKQLIEIELDRITIPPVYAMTQPSRQKIDSILYHYHVWGTLDKPIEVVIIEGQYILLDGYARWIVANNNNMRLINASILAEY